MRVVTIDVMIGGELTQQLHGKTVTIPEVAILQKLHGPNSIYNVRPTPKDWMPENEREKRMVKGDQNDERDRLRAEYGINRKTHVLVADEVFPGAVTRLPDTLAEIGMDPVTMAANMREKAKQLLAAADLMETSDELPVEKPRTIKPEKAA